MREGYGHAEEPRAEEGTGRQAPVPGGGDLEWGTGRCPLRMAGRLATAETGASVDGVTADAASRDGGCHKHAGPACSLLSTSWRELIAARSSLRRGRPLCREVMASLLRWLCGQGPISSRCRLRDSRSVTPGGAG